MPLSVQDVNEYSAKAEPLGPVEAPGLIAALRLLVDPRIRSWTRAFLAFVQAPGVTPGMVEQLVATTRDPERRKSLLRLLEEADRRPAALQDVAELMDLAASHDVDGALLALARPIVESRVLRDAVEDAAQLRVLESIATALEEGLRRAEGGAKHLRRVADALVGAPDFVARLSGAVEWLATPDGQRFLELGIKVKDSPEASLAFHAKRAVPAILKSLAAAGAESSHLDFMEAAADLCAATPRHQETLARIFESLRARPEQAQHLLEDMKRLTAGDEGPAGKRSFHVVPDVYGRNYHLLHDVREEPAFREPADLAVASKKSLLHYDRLFNLHQALTNVARAFPGETLGAAEVGVYRGGTSRFICDVLRRLRGADARFFAVDTFEGHSGLDLHDGHEGLHVPGMFGKTSFDEVQSVLAEFPFASVLKARIQDCAEALKTARFHFVHLDVDIYEPMIYSLRLFWPLLVPGGIIVVDDYMKTSCPGVRQAVDPFVDEAAQSAVRLYTQTAQCMLIKVR